MTQVLSNGTSTYLYGTGRIAQQQTNVQYFGADGLGSVRQLYNASGQVIANTRYDPYGNVLSQSGVGTSAYGFTGEWTDSYINLLYLRARWYDPYQGRFTTRDVWEGDYTVPMSYNAWLYVYANPINGSDPTGLQGPTPGCLPGSPYCVTRTPCPPGSLSRDCAPTPTPPPDFHLPVYGVSIEKKFDRQEYDLINNTLKDYAGFLGGEATFRKNVLLYGITKNDSILSGLPAGYDPDTHLILVAPNLYHAVKVGNSEIPPMNMFGSDAFPNVPKSTFPNQETVFKFVLAHEVTHGLGSQSPELYESFVDNMIPLKQGCFPINVLIALLGSRDWPNDPIIDRNRPRNVYDKKQEVFADVIAAHLYAPSLMGNTRSKYEDWIQHKLPGLLK